MVDRKKQDYREDLTGEHPFGDMGQVILLFIFLVVWILDSFVFRFLTIFAEHISLYVRMPLSILCLIVGIYFVKAGHNIALGTIREEPVVIRRGVFRIVRHPIYLGSILLCLGFVVSTISVLTTVIWLVIVFFYHFLARYEEKLLLKKFGKDYEEYMIEVPMWIPRSGKQESLSDK